MKKKLSIGITAYNQSSLIKENLLNILKYHGDDIEIIVQDDCSTENIKKIIEELNDSRILYFRNSTNLGHDRNIIELFTNCSSDYVFLLRSSDFILDGGIEKILNFIVHNPQVGYCRFSCLDEDNKVRINYADSICQKGNDSVQLHRELLIHPSGELYNLNYFNEKDWTCYKNYLDKYFDNNKKFVVHTMMRCKLIICAGIASSSEFVWRYTKTTKRKDIAENRSYDGMCVYHPIFRYQRYNCVMSYIINELDGEGKENLVKAVIDECSWLIIYVFRHINKDKNMQYHYNYKAIHFSSLKEMREFKKKTKEFSSQYNEPFRSMVINHSENINLFTLLNWHYMYMIKRVKSIWNKAKNIIIKH